VARLSRAAEVRPASNLVSPNTASGPQTPLATRGPLDIVRPRIGRTRWPRRRPRAREGRGVAMKWWRRGRVARWGLAVSVALSGAAGCQAGAPTVNGPRPDFPQLLTLSGSEAAQVRGQKPVLVNRGRGFLDIGPNDPGSKENRGARIRAVVNGEAILEEEVQAAAYQQMAGAQLSDEERAKVLNRVLEEIIDREVVVQDAIAKVSKGPAVRFLKELQDVAHKEFDRQWVHRLMRANGFTDEEKFKSFLKDNGMPLEMLRRSWERNFIAMEYMRTRVNQQ